MRLSFVIPTRNQARYIAACIDSCLQQNIPDAELIVADGASTDDTLAVLRAYGDRVSVVSEPDRGQSDAINKGIRRARGELIAWINSDDYYASPDAISTLLAAFDEDPRVDIAYGDGVRVDVEGKRLGAYRSRTLRGPAELVTHPASFVLQPSVLFRRELFLSVGGVDESLQYTMDYELWMRLFPAARATRYLPREIACARYHTNAKSISHMARQIREAYGVKLSAARRLEFGLVDHTRLHAGMASLWAYWLAVRTGLRRAV